MTNFEQAWARVAKGGMSPQLEALVAATCEAIDSSQRRVEAVATALEHLLVFLASPAGRTDQNCHATDHFFCWAWDGDWEWLPDAYQDILGDIAGALHDSVSAPEIAANFESTPEQLLARLRGVRPN